MNGDNRSLLVHKKSYYLKSCKFNGMISLRIITPSMRNDKKRNCDRENILKSFIDKRNNTCTMLSKK